MYDLQYFYFQVAFNLSSSCISVNELKHWLQGYDAKGLQCPVVVVGTHLDKLPPHKTERLIAEWKEKVMKLNQIRGKNLEEKLISVQLIMHQNGTLNV